MNSDSEIKVGYAVKVLSLYLLLAVICGKVTTNFQIAFGITCSFQLWSFFWINILLGSPNIYAIKVLSAIIPDWIPVSIPCENETLKIRKDRVVTSISELSGIRGGHMMVALRTMSAITCVLTIMAVQNDLHYRKAQFFDFLAFQSAQDMVPICLFISAMGKFMTGHFELNMLDPTHTKGHYMGVVGISTGTLGLGFCMKWNTLSKVMIGTYFGLAVIWSAYCAKCPKKSNDIRVVTRTSKICIGIELAMFNVYATILAMICYASGPNEGNLFASPLFV